MGWRMAKGRGAHLSVVGSKVERLSCNLRTHLQSEIGFSFASNFKLVISRCVYLYVTFSMICKAFSCRRRVGSELVTRVPVEMCFYFWCQGLTQQPPHLNSCSQEAMLGRSICVTLETSKICQSLLVFYSRQISFWAVAMTL